MLIDRIKCPICKEEVSSFYIHSGICPVCKSAFNSARQKVSNTGLRQLQREKIQYKKDTMTKGQIKRIFKLTEAQIAQIPSNGEFGKIRYYKTDVANFVNKK